MKVYIFYIASGWLGGQVMAIAENVDRARELANETVRADKRAYNQKSDKDILEVGQLIMSFDATVAQAFILDDGDY